MKEKKKIGEEKNRQVSWKSGKKLKDFLGKMYKTKTEELFRAM